MSGGTGTDNWTNCRGSESDFASHGLLPPKCILELVDADAAPKTRPVVSRICYSFGPIRPNEALCSRQKWRLPFSMFEPPSAQPQRRGNCGRPSWRTQVEIRENYRRELAPESKNAEKSAILRRALSNCYYAIKLVAEGEGFEPSIPFWGIHAFQACAFNHSAIPPAQRGPSKKAQNLTERGWGRNESLARTSAPANARCRPKKGPPLVPGFRNARLLAEVSAAHFGNQRALANI